MTRRLYLVRHAAVSVPCGVCYGRSDVALATSGKAHAQWLLPLLPPAPIFSSPLSRCLLLARALAGQAGTVQVDARLAEMDFGDWEMRAYDDIPREQIDAWAAAPLAFRVPGGESGEVVMTRVEAALMAILDATNEAIIVSHGGPLRAIMGKLLGLPREDWLAQEVPLSSLSILASDGEAWRMDAQRLP